MPFFLFVCVLFVSVPSIINNHDATGRPVMLDIKLVFIDSCLDATPYFVIKPLGLGFKRFT